jgi:hypothetical protein
VSLPQPAPSAAALIGFGQVRHTRLRPQRNAFAYPTCFLMLPMRSLAGSAGPLAVNRAGAISFHDADHGDGRGPEQGGALAWMDALLRGQGITDADGEVWLQCYPRMLGHTFKPVSFWYCHRADGRLRAIVAEVNNTFGERHCYLLDEPRYGVEQTARKVFHVSPFCDVAGAYRFRFLRTQRPGEPERIVVRVDHDDASGPLLQTSLSGALQPVTAASLGRALWGHPALTLVVLARIHWQAARLWWRRTGFRRKPLPPTQFVTR